MTALGRFDFRGGAAKCTLLAGIGSGDMTIAIAGDDSGWPNGGTGRHFIVEIDRLTSGRLEKIECSALSGGVLTVVTRGYDGSTALAHDVGASIEHCLGATVIDDLAGHVYDSTRTDHQQYIGPHVALTATLDGSGNATVTHGFGFTPVVALVQERAGTDHLQVTALATTTMNVHGTAGQAVSFWAWGLRA